MSHQQDFSMGPNTAPKWYVRALERMQMTPAEKAAKTKARNARKKARDARSKGVDTPRKSFTLEGQGYSVGPDGASQGENKCDVVTLKNQVHRQAVNGPKNGVIMFSQALSTLQLMAAGRAYYVEVANSGMRGGVARRDAKPGVFDVAVHPQDESAESIKAGMLSIIREKAVNDVHVYHTVIEAMVADGRLTEDQGKAARIDPYKDLSEEFASPNMARVKSNA